MINVISLPKKAFVASVLLKVFVRSPSITALISYIQYIDKQWCVLPNDDRKDSNHINSFLHLWDHVHQFILWPICTFIETTKAAAHQGIYRIIQKEGRGGGRGGTLNRFNWYLINNSMTTWTICMPPYTRRIMMFIMVCGLYSTHCGHKIKYLSL